MYGVSLWLEKWVSNVYDTGVIILCMYIVSIVYRVRHCHIENGKLHSS